MKLSIITINYNDAKGLRKTLQSVASQATGDRLQAIGLELEHIIIDGGSTDGSIDVIRDYESSLTNSPFSRLAVLPTTIKWISEKDKGVYNAMNKGIKMATGDYIQILNSGDILASDDVIVRMNEALSIENTKRLNASSDADKRLNVNAVDLIYGNMLVDGGEGSFSGSKEVEYSLKQYYSSTLNHDCCWIKRSLFETYGLYDENLKIVSDWKWWLQAIGLGHVKPVYVDVDMTIFEGGGISSMQLDRRNQERRQVLEELLPPAILADYDKHAFDMVQMDRLRKHHLYGLVYFIERTLFKLEKWHILK